MYERIISLDSQSICSMLASPDEAALRKGVLHGSRTPGWT
jgi:hypothetical protein